MEKDKEGKFEPVVFDKGSRLETFFTGSCCILVFVLSSILWIILFRALMIKNGRVRALVYDIPTLGIFHDKYNDFFHLYDKERENVLAESSVFKNGDLQHFNDSKGKILTMLTNLDALSNDIAEAKAISSGSQ